MSKIDEQIKILQNKKAKIDYYNQLKKQIREDISKKNSLKDIKDELVSEISSFVENKINFIENDEDSQILNSFDSGDIKILKDLILRVKKTSKPSDSKVSPKKMDDAAISGNKDLEERPDKIRFALQNRHLDHKMVRVISDSGDLGLGIVVGLDAPNAVVKLNSGVTVRVTLDKLVVQG